MTDAIGYVRVSTDEQADSRLGLDAQRAAIVAEAERRGWHLVEIVEDAAVSGRDLDRPGMALVLHALQARRADTMVVAKLDRLGRSLLDVAGLIEMAARQGWALVALDVGVDTASLTGKAMAGMMAVFAELERGLIGQRTRDALRAARERGTVLGRPRVLSDEVLEERPVLMDGLDTGLWELGSATVEDLETGVTLAMPVAQPARTVAPVGMWHRAALGMLVLLLGSACFVGDWEFHVRNNTGSEWLIRAEIGGGYGEQHFVRVVKPGAVGPALDWIGERERTVEVVNADCEVIGVFETDDGMTFTVEGIDGLEGSVHAWGTHLEEGKSEDIIATGLCDGVVFM